jgi:hypothetical protein
MQRGGFGRVNANACTPPPNGVNPRMGLPAPAPPQALAEAARSAAFGRVGSARAAAGRGGCPRHLAVVRAGGGGPPAPVTHKAAGSRFHAMAALLLRRLRRSWQREGRRRKEQGAHGILPWCARAATPPAPVTHKAAGCRFHTRASLLVRRLRRSWQREGGGGKSRIGVGMRIELTPPSEPDVRISRIRLSG